MYFTHRLPYAECLQVPLMLRLPGGLHGGTRVPDPVSLVGFDRIVVTANALKQLEERLA